MVQVVEVFVEGGKVFFGLFFGLVIGLFGFNVKQVVDEINKVIKEFEGMQVFVKIIVEDFKKKIFCIEVGILLMSQFIKKEFGILKGLSEVGYIFVGNFIMEQVIKIVKMKIDQMFVLNFKVVVKEVIGIVFSMGVIVEGKDFREVQREIDEGVYDEFFVKVEEVQ